MLRLLPAGVLRSADGGEVCVGRLGRLWGQIPAVRCDLINIPFLVGTETLVRVSLSMQTDCKVKHH